MPAFVAIAILSAFALTGALSVLLVPRWVQQVKAWSAARAKAGALRPEGRKAICDKAIAFGEELERFGRETLDHEIELLGIVLMHSTYQVTHGGDARTRWNRLRGAADVVAPYRVNKWWRPRVRPAAHPIWQILRLIELEHDSGEE